MKQDAIHIYQMSPKAKYLYVVGVCEHNTKLPKPLIGSVHKRQRYVKESNILERHTFYVKLKWSYRSQE